jgi:hypothetical protein
MTASKAQQAQTSSRRADLIRLRLTGARYNDPRVLALGYATSGAARKDMIRALEQSRNEEAAEASVYRQLENERLDALLEAAWPRAIEPQPILNREGDVIGQEIDLRAVETVLKLMDRRAKLNGLDMPVKAELSGPGGGAVPLASGSLDELNALIGFAGQPAQASAGEQEDAGGNTNG